MIKVIKYLCVVLLIAFIGLQFFRGEYPDTRFENPDDVFLTVESSPEVKAIVRAACYDCHSMETNYPWYSRVAPISWWIIEHVDHGRDELNLSEFGSLSKRSKIRKLKDIAEEVEKEKMPLPSYLRGHPEARLTSEQRQLIYSWANQSAKEVLTKK